MAPSDFANADLDDVVNQLTTQEAILLTAGVGFWHTHAIERLGIPAIKVRAPFLYIYRNADRSPLIALFMFLFPLS
jgi:hypothetical protein